MKIYLDFETRSRADIKKVGAWKYSLDPSTEILCVAYAIADGPVLCLGNTALDAVFPFVSPGKPRDTRSLTFEAHNAAADGPVLCLKNMAKKAVFPFVSLGLPGDTGSLTFEAHNAAFEYAIWHNIGVKRYGWPEIPADRWECSAALSAYYSLPRGLGAAGLALALAVQKDQTGRRVMLQLCKPRKPTNNNPDEWFTIEKYPEKYQLLYDYCKKDVEAERAISKALPPLPRSANKPPRGAYRRRGRESCSSNIKDL